MNDDSAEIRPEAVDTSTEAVEIPEDPASTGTSTETTAGSEPVEGPEPGVPAYQRYDCRDAGDTVAVRRAAEAARIAVSRGECVVIPTDTVYGIGADAFDADAVQRLLDAKGRGRDMPPPVLIADARLLKALASDVPQTAKDLVDACWPGPLTIICKAQSSLRMDLGDTEGTIALRVPDHELARELLRRTGPMAVSSANLSGKPAALTCDEAIGMLGDSVSVYLDGGAVAAPDPLTASSTIIDFASTEKGRVLRTGGLSLDVVREYCPDLIDPGAQPGGAEEPVEATVPYRLRHTLQPPLERTAADEWLADEGLDSADDVEDLIDEAADEPPVAREDGEWRVDDEPDAGPDAGPDAEETPAHSADGDAAANNETTTWPPRNRVSPGQPSGIPVEDQ